jgi:hypothetical protein
VCPDSSSSHAHGKINLALTVVSTILIQANISSSSPAISSPSPTCVPVHGVTTSVSGHGAMRVTSQRNNMMVDASALLALFSVLNLLPS